MLKSDPTHAMTASVAKDISYALSVHLGRGAPAGELEDEVAMHLLGRWSAPFCHRLKDRANESRHTLAPDGASFSEEDVLWALDMLVVETCLDLRPWRSIIEDSGGFPMPVRLPARLVQARSVPPSVRRARARRPRAQPSPSQTPWQVPALRPPRRSCRTWARRRRGPTLRAHTGGRETPLLASSRDCYCRRMGATWWTQLTWECTLF